MSLPSGAASEGDPSSSTQFPHHLLIPLHVCGSKPSPRTETEAGSLTAGHLGPCACPWRAGPAAWMPLGPFLSRRRWGLKEGLCWLCRYIVTHQEGPKRNKMGALALGGSRDNWHCLTYMCSGQHQSLGVPYTPTFFVTSA